MVRLVLFIFVFSGFLPMQEVRAASQDECAIWLCLPGGFPQGCAAAHSAMLQRLKKFKPPLPDFGSCAEGGSGSYVLGYEPYEPCIEEFELSHNTDARPAQCVYNLRYTYNEGGICAGEGITTTERICYYTAVERPKPYFIEMTVEGEYLGKFFYQ